MGTRPKLPTASPQSRRPTTRGSRSWCGRTGSASWSTATPPGLSPRGPLVETSRALADVRPFRLGLTVALAGQLLTLGTAHGGTVGDGLESLVALGLGTTGASILAVLLAVAGTPFLPGASLGAIVR